MLPFKSVYISSNYVDRSEHVDDGTTIMEIPRTKKYSKGSRIVSNAVNRFCGKQQDFAGSAVPVHTPLPRDSTGNLLCCTNEQKSVVYVDVFMTTSAVFFSPADNTGFDDFGGLKVRASALAFDMLSNLPVTGNAQGPWQVDLLKILDLGGGQLSDQVVCDYPGYAPQVFFAPGPIADDGTGTALVLPCGPHHFEAKGDMSSGPFSCIGYCVSDATGAVLFSDAFNNEMFFANQGDYVDLNFTLSQQFDTP
jgi:hypothetical protein